MKSLYLASVLLVGSMGISPAQNVGLQPLDASSVTTPGSGTVVAAVGTVYKSCWVQNDPSSSYNLIVDAINVANYSTPASTATILAPGQKYVCPGGMTYTLTVDAQDAGHKIYGDKY